MSNYKLLCAILLLLLSGCCESTRSYNPKGWPRTVVVQSTLETEAEVQQLEYVRRAVDEINRRTGAAVFQVAVTLDIKAARRDTIHLSFTREPFIARPDAIGIYVSQEETPYTSIEVQARPGTVGQQYGDEGVVVHELLHSLLGNTHDEEPDSIFYYKWHCLYLPDLPEYEQRAYCLEASHRATITDSLVERIRAKMELPPAPVYGEFQ